jgi:hypothetical protein
MDNKKNEIDKNQVETKVVGSKNTTISVGGDNKGTIAIFNNIPSSASIFLAAISLLADIIALGQLAYNIIVGDKTPTNLVLQLVAIILVFLLGYGLGVLGLRGFAKTSIEKVLRVYVWGYLILACMSYLGVVSIFRSSYTFASYIAYAVIIVIQLAAFMILRSVSQVRPVIAHALALMTVSVIHALVFLYYIIYVAVPELNYLIGEWVFWFAWTLYAVPMLRSAFSSNSNVDVVGGRPRSPFR